MIEQHGLTVSEVSRLSGASVRALHHYDEIGLLVPSARTAAGYRLYGDADLARLQEILLFRELEIPLDDIATLLSGGAVDR
ncbi:MAG: MerR family transcriptional regulator, partial [Coriobacteriia bacterium]|nr:MerR family transcriptional regulator [Coriobacteriia bacterium]